MKHVIGSRLVDSLAVLWSGSTATADGALGTGLDLGAVAGLALADTNTKGGDGLVLFEVVMDITAVDVASTDETYTFRLFGANIADFSAKALCGTYEIGRAAITGTAKRLGRHVFLGRNWALDDFSTAPEGGGTYTSFRFLRLEIDVGGTSPSVTGAAYLMPLTSTV